jgi:hypothetical protein
MSDTYRLQAYVPRELKLELNKKAEELGISVSAITTMCLRAGLDVLKVALSTDYIKVMELLSREYEIKKER